MCALSAETPTRNTISGHLFRTNTQSRRPIIYSVGHALAAAESNSHPPRPRFPPSAPLSTRRDAVFNPETVLETGTGKPRSNCVYPIEGENEGFSKRIERAFIKAYYFLTHYFPTDSLSFQPSSFNGRIHLCSSTDIAWSNVTGATG